MAATYYRRNYKEQNSDVSSDWFNKITLRTESSAYRNESEKQSDNWYYKKDSPCWNNEEKCD